MPEVVDAVSRRALTDRVIPPLSAVVEEARPRQWSKNLFLFAGLIFGERLASGEAWVGAVLGFLLFCGASSAAYLVNDVLDAPRDRTHPLKRHRPIARGDLGATAALVLGSILAAAALAGSFVLPAPFRAILAAFVALQLVYTLFLKHIVVVDLLSIAALFVLRAAAGAAAIGVRISPWLLVCTGLLSLLLATAKRRAEASAAPPSNPAAGRPVLRHYSALALDRLIAAVAVATFACYCVYAFAGSKTDLIALTIPWVALGLARYVTLVTRHSLGEEPENVLLSDRVMMATIAVWTLVAALVFAVFA